MSYIEKNIRADENIEYRAINSRVSHSFSLIISFLLISILPLGIFYWLTDAEKQLSLYYSHSLKLSLLILSIPAVIGILILFLLFFRLKYTEAIITNKRTINSKGFFSIDITEIPHTKLESIQIKQSFFGRLLNFGDVILTGSGFVITKISRIKDPENFRRELGRAFEDEDDFR